MGIEIHRNRQEEKLFLSQKKYIEKVLERFVMLDVKPMKTPLAAHFRLLADFSPQTDEEEKYMSHVPYTNAVGSIMYAMVCTRPDISHAVSVVSQYINRPAKDHWPQ